jgi:hypothetical protein
VRRFRVTSSAFAPQPPPPTGKAANCRFKSAVLNPPYLNALVASVPKDVNNVLHNNVAAQLREEEDRAFQTVKGMEKHQNQNGKKKQKHNEYEYEEGEHRKSPSGSQTQRDSSQRQNSASKSRPTAKRTTRGYDHPMTDDDVLKSGPVTVQGSAGHGKNKKDLKAVHLQVVALPYLFNTNTKQSKKAEGFEQQQTERLLVPQSQSGRSRTDAIDRKRHTRLAGADLYVTRLGWNNCNIARPHPMIKPANSEVPVTTPPSSSESEPDLECPSLTSSISSVSTLGATGSLYDELRCHKPRTTPPTADIAPTIPREAIHASQPCYRCVSYMHAVGIKRVFWTNDDGEWEGGKVAQFIGALDGEGDGAGCGGGPMGNGVFVTKHEVLKIMRRTMGE